MMALRVVTPDEVPPAKTQTVSQAAKGSQRDLLVAMRDRIATAVTDSKCPPRDLASLTKRLGDIVREIEAIDAREVDDPHARIRDLELALRSVAPEHELLNATDGYDDTFDAASI